MSSPSQLPVVGQDRAQWASLSTESPSYLLLVCILAAMLVYSWNLSNDTMKGTPYVNPAGFFSSARAKRKFLASGESLAAQAREKLRDNQICRIMTDVGERLVLSPDFIEEIHNKSDMSFLGAFGKDYHYQIPGYEPIHLATESDLLLSTIKKHLMKMQPNWHEMDLLPILVDIVSRLTSRVLLGEELCRNDDWIRVTKEYLYGWFFESPKLHVWPRPLHRLVHWMLPGFKALRAQLQESRRLLTPTMTKRQEMKQAALAAGVEVPKFDDAFEWLEDEAAARGLVYDEALVANFGITVSLFSLHTTSDTMKKIVVDFAQHQDSVESIRGEVLQQLQAEGMSKTSFYKMQLLDSAMKESQRMNPLETIMLRRLVQKETQLSNGLVLKEGTQTLADTSYMRDPVVYQNPDRWDATRFLKLRSQPGMESMAQLESPSLYHLGFGYGKHACPGRFFAVNTLKVVLCHLLLKYEWKLSPGVDADSKVIGTGIVANPAIRVLIRHREKVEFDFTSI
ncbi:cytochrome P450 [Hypoxylon trugodes]|uniref:cytochrome P450 n=1 Tax=Hypoxylon trugodes TaxID=326681 RepID=UPI0021982706|nr:cytochrome P450 [Hypoxylon trugodes]KAI1383559.1 cytochrome P450 [Hypoxylon trugodes]